MKKNKPWWHKTTFFGIIFALAILGSYLFVNLPVVVQQVQYATGDISVEPVSTDTGSIKIPSLGVSAPIVWASDNNKEKLQAQLLEGVVHYPETALPGETGNGVYVGHSSNYWWETSDYNTVFGLIDKLETGDEVIINYEGQDYNYEVTSNKSVPKDSGEIWERSDKQKITLVTCWPRGTNIKNFFVRAALQQ